jgi:hypothetical protein
LEGWRALPRGSLASTRWSLILVTQRHPDPPCTARDIMYTESISALSMYATITIQLINGYPADQQHTCRLYGSKVSSYITRPVCFLFTRPVCTVSSIVSASVDPRRSSLLLNANRHRYMQCVIFLFLVLSGGQHLLRWRRSQHWPGDHSHSP